MDLLRKGTSRNSLRKPAISEMGRIAPRHAFRYRYSSPTKAMLQSLQIRLENSEPITASTSFGGYNFTCFNREELNLTFMCEKGILR